MEKIISMIEKNNLTKYGYLPFKKVKLIEDVLSKIPARSIQSFSSPTLSNFIEELMKKPKIASISILKLF